jgi:predicted enzyme related to lactoylglutathione lyase
MIKGIKFCSIPVADQDRALDFYTTKLGFGVATDQAMGPQRWIELRIPGADTRVVLFTPPGQEERVGSFASIAYWTDSVENTYNELSAKGVEFTQKPTKADWGTSAIFKDSEGNTFVVGTK